MSGMLNTGQFTKSGIVNKVQAGSNAFVVGVNGNTWVTYTGATVTLNDDSGSGLFDDGNNFNTSNYTYTTPSTGLYCFGIHVYTAWTGSNHSFNIRDNGSDIVVADSVFGQLTQLDGHSNDMTKDSILIHKLAGGRAITLYAANPTDWHTGLSYFWGYQIY